MALRVVWTLCPAGAGLSGRTSRTLAVLELKAKVSCQEDQSSIANSCAGGVRGRGREGGGWSGGFARPAEAWAVGTGVPGPTSGRETSSAATLQTRRARPTGTWGLLGSSLWSLLWLQLSW